MRPARPCRRFLSDWSEAPAPGPAEHERDRTIQTLITLNEPPCGLERSCHDPRIGGSLARSEDMRRCTDKVITV